MILVSSRKGTMKAMTIVKQDKAYVYLELGQREYFTITLDNKSKQLKSSRDFEKRDNDLESNNCCIWK